MNYNLIAYAMDFASFLLEKSSEQDIFINQIILFGSVARGEAQKESDIDIFVDIKDEKSENKIQQIRNTFNGTIKFKKYWQLLGVNNEINCLVGNIDTVGDLKRSIIQNGIILFGSYQGKLKTELYNLLIVTPSKNRNKNISVWRALYGYKQKASKKVYTQQGLLKTCNGKKLARGVLIVPALHTPTILSFLKQNKFQYQIFPFWQEKT